MNIKEIDKHMNFSEKNNDFEFYNAKSEPFTLCGFYQPLTSTPYRRLNENLAKSVNPSIFWLATHTAGGRVRFTAETSALSIFAVLTEAAKMSNMVLAASSGFDLYIDNKFYYSYIPPFDTIDKFSGNIDIVLTGKHNYEINFPLYTGVVELYLGFPKDAIISKCPPYEHLPIAYYGSSITQGASCAHPGNSYESFVSRWLNADYYNFGFSGSAQGEPCIAEYIATLNLSAFVLDYDHNAATAKALKETHHNFYKIIRAKHPYIPILMMSRPEHCLFEVISNEVMERRQIVYDSYLQAVNDGDENIYYIDGQTLFSDDTFMGVDNADNCTIDQTHPNDLGFYRMAKKVANILKGKL